MKLHLRREIRPPLIPHCYRTINIILKRLRYRISDNENDTKAVV